MGKTALKAKVPVSERAVLQRVNRKLAPKYEGLRKWRTSGHQGGESWQPGDVHHVDFRYNAMLNVKVDLERFAREVGALADWETLAE